MRTAAQRVEEIFANDALNADDGPSKCEVLEEMLPELGWSVVLEHLLAILRQPDRRPSDWDTAAEVLWGAALDGRPMPVDVVVAHLCHRWWGPAQPENNLAWSIISKLKQVDYLSEYDPLADAGVLRELARLQVAG